MKFKKFILKLIFLKYPCGIPSSSESLLHASEIVIPKILKIEEKKGEGQGHEGLKRKIRDFLKNHVQIDVANIFQVGIDTKLLINEFNRICEEGSTGVVLDLYVATIYCLTYYMLSSCIYKIDGEFVKRLSAIICYIMDHQDKIIENCGNAQEFHAQIASLCKPSSGPLLLKFPRSVPTSLIREQILNEPNCSTLPEMTALKALSAANKGKYPLECININQVSRIEN